MRNRATYQHMVKESSEQQGTIACCSSPCGLWRQTEYKQLNSSSIAYLPCNFFKLLFLTALGFDFIACKKILIVFLLLHTHTHTHICTHTYVVIRTNVTASEHCLWWCKQQKFIFSLLEGWRSKIQVPSRLVCPGAFVLGVQMVTSSWLSLCP
jgi:hypothetical protein